MSDKELAIVLRARADIAPAFKQLESALLNVNRHLGTIRAQAVTFRGTMVAALNAVRAAATGMAMGISRSTRQSGISLLRLAEQMRARSAAMSGGAQFRGGAGGMLQGMAARALGGAGALTGGMGAGLLGASTAMPALFRSFGQLGTVIRNVAGIAGSLFVPMVTGALSLAQTIGGTLMSAFNGLLSWVRTAGGVILNWLHKAALGGAALAAAIGGAAALVARHGLHINELFSSAQIGFSTLLKSSSQATGFMAALRKEARTSAFEFVNLVGWAQSLLAAGYRLKDIIPTMRALGDAAFIQGSHGAAERMERLVYVFREVMNKGRMMGSEIMQMASAGINARALLKIPQGQDVGLLDISGAAAIPRLIAGIQNQFGGMQAKLAETMTVTISNIHDAWNDFTAQITEGFWKSWTRALQGVLKMFNSMNESVAGKKLIGMLTSGFDALGVFVEKLAGQLPTLTEQLVDFLTGERWLRFLATARAVFDEIMAAAGRLIAWFIGAWPSMWSTAQGVAVSAVRVIGGGISGLIEVVREFWGSLGTGDSIWVRFAQAGLAVIRMLILAVGELSAQLIGALHPSKIIGDFVSKKFGGVWGSEAAKHFGGGTVPIMQAAARGGAGLAAAGVGSINPLQIVAAIKPALAQIGSAMVPANLAAAGQRGFNAFGAGMDDFMARVAGNADAHLRGMRAGIGPAVAAASGLAPAHDMSGRGGGAGGGAGAAGGLPPLDFTKKAKPESVAQILSLTESIIDATKEGVTLAQEQAAAMGNQREAAMHVLRVLEQQVGSLKAAEHEQLRLLAVTQPWSADWIKIAKAVSETRKEMLGARAAARDLAVDTSRISAALSTSEKMMSLARDAGMSNGAVQSIAAEQQGILTQLLSMERSRLGMVEAGTEQWHKQRGVIVDIVSKFVTLRKEIQEANGEAGRFRPFMPATPFGVRGVGPEMGMGPSAGVTGLARMAGEMLRQALSAPSGGPGMLATAPAGAGLVVSPMATINVSTLNDLTTIEQVARRAADQSVDKAVRRLTSIARDRGQTR